ncbi:hypothetical protein ACHAWF_000442, partial [Thalassiosira exigua]
QNQATIKSASARRTTQNRSPRDPRCPPLPLQARDAAATNHDLHRTTWVDRIVAVSLVKVGGEGDEWRNRQPASTVAVVAPIEKQLHPGGPLCRPSVNPNPAMSDSADVRPDDVRQHLTASWWFADVANSFVTYTFVGAAWGAFNPYPVPGSSHAQALAKTSKFVPLPPFSSLASVGRYAGVFGSVFTLPHFVSGGMAVARKRQDMLNVYAGVVAVFGYAYALFESERRLAWNNRAVAGIFVGSAIYSGVQRSELWEFSCQ